MFLNTHQHAQLIPGVLQAMLVLAREHGIFRTRYPLELAPRPNRRLRSWVWPAASLWARGQRAQYTAAGVRHPHGILGGPDSERLSPERLHRLLYSVNDGVTELVVHPALGTDDSRALASDELGRILHERSIERVGFHVL